MSEATAKPRGWSVARYCPTCKRYMAVTRPTEEDPDGLDAVLSVLPRGLPCLKCDTETE